MDTCSQFGCSDSSPDPQLVVVCVLSLQVGLSSTYWVFLSVFRLTTKLILGAIVNQNGPSLPLAFQTLWKMSWTCDGAIYERGEPTGTKTEPISYVSNAKS
ncbi:hypothetical protein BDV29DRAFT_20707 [Aspergillus leporis]|uniref:Uncharacterized protein n=1 Tax=Aspergillus leporis TaxID=41062 RepID=A0A5N5XBQ9_9EURO|nr:hypothetical protein BDV29DRAFT_20707 [Aspergillus leporis]